MNIPNNASSSGAETNFPISAPGPAQTAQLFAVWFYSGSSESLDDIRQSSAIFQDLVIVCATSEQDALVVSADLLAERSEFDSTITRVVSKAELQRVLGLLARVEEGRISPATLEDEDHMVWAERFCYDAEPDVINPVPLDAAAMMAIRENQSV